MSRALSREQYMFVTDLGAVKVTREEVVEYDVEDMVADRASSQAEIARMENIAANIDVNAFKFPRQISASAYL